LGGRTAHAETRPRYAETVFDRFKNRVREVHADEAGRIQAPTRPKKKTGRAPAGMRGVVDFTSASYEHTEPASDDSRTLGTSQQTIGPIEIPAYGFIRHVFVLVEISGLTGGTAHEDSPFRALSEVSLFDVNGAPIFGPFDGYETYLANLYGGYAFQQDPRLQPDGTFTTPNFVFGLRVPVEISHNNGLGAIANQNAAASLKLRLGVNTLANIWSAAPTGTGTIRVRTWLEAWSQPTMNDPAGRAQEMVPPMHGTSQYWSKFERAVNSGSNTIQLPRVGNLIRAMIFILRVSNVRSAANLPDPVILNWDARQLINEPRYLRRAYMAERVITAAAGHPAGVLFVGYNHDNLGHAGDDTPELWLPTVQSTRLELNGTFGAAGQLTVLTNDVAPVEVDQLERFQVPNESGFTPDVGAPVTA
jgi:hypothetical protein